MSALLLVVTGTIGVSGAGATAPTCSSVGITVAPLHGNRFYVDSKSSPVLDSGYTGIAITPTAARTNIWVKLTGFTGGALGLNANQPAGVPLGNLGAASTTPAYFFLTAAPVADNVTAQNFSVDVYQGDPSRSGTQLCSFADGFSGGVYDTLQAAANKVQDVTGDSISSSVSTSSPTIGGAITLTVEGTTGTLGNGPDGTPFIYETPTSTSSWPTGSFRLIGTTLTLNPGASQTVYTNELQLSNASWSAAQNYIAQYTFQITGTTASATTAVPIQEISSGTQVKHTNLSSLAAIPAIQPASNPLTLAQTVNPTSLTSSGGTVAYTVSLSSSAATSASLDQIVDALPAGATYQAGTAKLDGTTIADPASSGGSLVFPGPFTVTSAASRVLTFSATLPGTGGTYTASAVGYIAATQIDTTVSTADSAPATASTTVAAAALAQTITFAQPADTRVDQGPVALSASATSGLAVSFASTTTGVCTVSGTSVSLLSVGTCSITASQAGNGTYSAASPVSRSFQVTAAPLAQTITFAQPADVHIDEGPVTLSASASSGLTVGLSSSTTGVCTVSGTSVSLLAVGTCTVTAAQSGNGTYAAALPVTRSFAVTAAALLAQTILFAQPSDTRVDQGPVTVAASASSGLAVSFSSSTTGVCTLSGTSVTLVSAGSCTIVASQPGNGIYAAATPVDQSFQVTAAPLAQTIAFVQPADTRVDQGPVTVSASASSGLAVSFSSSTTGVCTVSGSTVSLVATGTCTIVAAQPGDATYAAASNVTRSFAVAAALLAQTITFVQPADTQVDAGPVVLSASATSGLEVSFASTTTSICTVAGTSVTLVSAGTCTITAHQGGDSTHLAATPVPRSFAVLAAPSTQLISFAQPADTRVDQGPVALAATASSGLGVSYASATPSVCAVSGSTVTLLGVGSCTITASQPGDATYAAAVDVIRSFQVTTAPLTQTIAFAGPGTTAVDQGPVPLAASATSGLAVAFSSNSSSICTVSGSTVTLVAVGTCSITASQAGDGTYTSAIPVTRTFAVTALAQTITFGQPGDTRVDQGPVSLSAGASSGLAVSFGSSTPSVCTVSGAGVTLLSAGTCTVTAAQGGDATYGAAADVVRSFQVTVAPATPTAQTITFAQPADLRVDQGPVSLVATASSGLGVSLASATPAVCTVSGTTAVLVGAGTCSIMASQAGDPTYAAAADVSRSFQVAALPASPTAQAIAFPQPADTRVDQGPLALTASASSGLAVSYGSSTTTVCTVSGSSVALLADGTCTITASQGGDATYGAATDVTRSFAVAAVPVAPSSPAAQSIAFPQPSDTQIDGGPVSLGSTASSGLAVSYASQTPAVCTVSGSSVTLLAAGTCTIAAAQAGDAAYAAAATVTRSFQVTTPATPTSQSITFPQPGDVRVDQGPVSLAATASSGLAVSYASATPSVCTVAASTVSLLTIGTCSITASQPGDAGHDPAADVTRSFAVTLVTPPVVVPAPPAPAPAPARAPQQIDLAKPAAAAVGDTIRVAVAASSGMPVTLGSETPDICTIDADGRVTVLRAGACTIVARQPGNGTWLAAADARQSFEVTLPPLVAPTSRPVTTIAGRTTENALQGMPVGATLTLTPAALPGVAKARIVDNRVVLTPKLNFSGIVDVPVVMIVGDRSVATTVAVVVRPKAPTSVVVTPQSAARSTISWAASVSAIGYVVRVDGRVVCRTSGTACALAELVAPNAHVEITSLGRQGTRSDDAPGAYTPGRPVLLATVHFATASSALATGERALLDRTESRIVRDGFTHAILTCHTDNVGSLPYNMALSAARCAAVAAYVKKRLGIQHVTYRQSAFGYLRPTAPNASRRGRAENRRVELYVR